jgi:hypothetical protein
MQLELPVRDQIKHASAESGAATLLVDWLARHKVGTLLRGDSLSLASVYGSDSLHGPKYRTLGDGLASGEVLVTEQAHASVGALKVLNRSSLPVLILDGEEVVGGLQNRVVNTTLLVPPKTAFDLPVSCVEHGRWHQVDGHFRAGDAAHPTLRRQKSQQVTASLHQFQTATSDQAAIWAEVDARHLSTGTHSATAALRDAFQLRALDIDRMVEGFAQPPDKATGVVLLLDGHAMCADLFDRPEALRHYWPRLVRSYALEALDYQASEPSMASAIRLLQRPAGATLAPFPSTGAGIDVRVNGNGVVGGALVHDGSVLHAALFRYRQISRDTNLQGPRLRARRYLRTGQI